MMTVWPSCELDACRLRSADPSAEPGRRRCRPPRRSRLARCRPAGRACHGGAATDRGGLIGKTTAVTMAEFIAIASTDLDADQSAQAWRRSRFPQSIRMMPAPSPASRRELVVGLSSTDRAAARRRSALQSRQVWVAAQITKTGDGDRPASASSRRPNPWMTAVLVATQSRSLVSGTASDAARRG